MLASGGRSLANGCPKPLLNLEKSTANQYLATPGSWRHLVERIFRPTPHFFILITFQPMIFFPKIKNFSNVFELTGPK
jgi:hypothetical protein